MSRILAIDPGPTESAYLLLVDGSPVEWLIFPNDGLARALRRGGPGAAGYWAPDTVVIEQMQGFGMAVGAEVFETVRWAGRFEEAAQPGPVVLIPRKAVKLHLCGNLRAKDPNIRQALIDKFGGPSSIRKGGALHGVSKDAWSALALAVTYSETVDAS